MPRSPLLAAATAALGILLLAASPDGALAGSPYAALSGFELGFAPRLFVRQLADLQSFTGALGGEAAPAIVDSGDPVRPFQVEEDTFTDFASAAQRTCDRQFNACAEIANSENNNGDFTVPDCDDQKNECNAAQQNAVVQDFASAGVNLGPDPADPAFDLICDA
ncbi:hypothetical protein BDY21DRAFT_368886 [Lineolata rhizophorae]|uniref:Uncharacterized protein n=1 Tax=Lineolata rhizophorae TaxID=578093 RepID=A0A6A6PCM4_9PEZI|nr:hypothetical protein BDY21DRAFT_368886 [Lineolata rhizophorae]